MFNIGDLVIYSTHGVCKIDDISEKTIAGAPKEYYELHPVDDEHHLTISAPANDDRVTILALMEEDEANEVLECFENPEMEKINTRADAYSKLVDTGDRKKLANVVNTLLRKQMELAENNKKLNGSERDLLDVTRDGLFQELAISLDTSYKHIDQTVDELLRKESVSSGY